MKSRASRRPSVRGTVGLVAVLLAAACASPRYEYVRNTEAKTAFRIPTDWTVFQESTVLQAPFCFWKIGTNRPDQKHWTLREP